MMCLQLKLGFLNNLQSHVMSDLYMRIHASKGGIHTTKT